MGGDMILGLPRDFVWLREWKNERIENTERIEKWEDKKYFSFSSLCLVGMVEKWMSEKNFCFVENKVGIN